MRGTVQGDCAEFVSHFIQNKKNIFQICQKHYSNFLKYETNLNVNMIENLFLLDIKFSNIKFIVHIIHNLLPHRRDW